MSPETDFDIEEYHRQEELKIRREINENDPILQRLRVVEFVSQSGGRGKRRRQRVVTLLVVDESYAYVVKNREIKSAMRRSHLRPDVLANEILTHLPPDERTTERLLSEVLIRARN